MKDANGSERALIPTDVGALEMFTHSSDPEMAEYLVPIAWDKTLPIVDAVREKGFFGNQNSVYQPVT